MFDSLMTALGGFFIHQPLNILLVAGLFFAGYLALRYTDLGEGRDARALLVPTIAWALYAAWEWAIMTFSPEANIRIDLLLIWLVLLLLSLWFLVKALRRTG